MTRFANHFVAASAALVLTFVSFQAVVTVPPESQIAIAMSAQTIA